MKNSQVLVLLSSLKMALATLSSRVLGLVREFLLARFFGASGMTDAFFIAYRIPNLLRDLFAEGGFSSAFVPVFTQAKVELNENEKFKVFRSAFWSLFLVTTFFALVIFFSAEFFVEALAPSFLEEPEKFAMTVVMVKIVSPFLILISLAAILMGVLNTHKVFFLPAVTPAFLNLSVILCILFLTDQIKDSGYPGIYSVAVGILIGGCAQFLLQIPILKKFGYSFTPTSKLITPYTKKIMNKMGPTLISFSANQVNILVNSVLATGAGVGAVSFLHYGFRLFQFPTGTLSVSLGNSHLVYFAEAWKKGDQEEAIKVFQNTFIFSLALMLPVTIFTIAFGDWIVHLVFEGGKFTRSDTMNAALALSLYAIAIPFEGLKKIMIPLYYTIDQQKVPVYLSLFAIAFNISFSLLTVDRYGFSALALSVALSTTLNASLQVLFLKKFLNFSWKFIFNKRVLRIVISVVVCALLAFSGLEKNFFFNEGFFLKIGLLALSATAFFLLYAVLLTLLGERQLINSLRKKFKKK